MTRFEYNENNFFTEWNDILRGKIVIVSDSKEEVKRWIEKDTIYNLDFVCPSDNKESPFCDFGDDELWTYAYYDPKIDYFWKLKHGYFYLNTEKKNDCIEVLIVPATRYALCRFFRSSYKGNLSKKSVCFVQGYKESPQGRRRRK